MHTFTVNSKIKHPLHGLDVGELWFGKGVCSWAHAGQGSITITGRYLQPYKVLQTQTLKLAEVNLNSKHIYLQEGDRRWDSHDHEMSRGPSENSLSKATYRSGPPKIERNKRNSPQNQNYSFAMHQSKNMCLPTNAALQIDISLG